MSKVTNLSPIETFEEGTYNILTMVSISGFISSAITIIHLIMFHSVISTTFLVIGGVSLIGLFVFPWLKRKRFGDKNLSLAERIVQLEGAVGVNA